MPNFAQQVGPEDSEVPEALRGEQEPVDIGREANRFDRLALSS